MVYQRLRVNNLIGEFHLPEKHFKLFSTEPRFGFYLSSNPIACYELFDTHYYTCIMRIAFNMGGKDFSAETMLAILEKLS